MININFNFVQSEKVNIKCNFVQSEKISIKLKYIQSEMISIKFNSDMTSYFCNVYFWWAVCFGLLFLLVLKLITTGVDT